MLRTTLGALGCASIVLFAAVPARADVVGIVRGTVTGPDRKPVAGASVTLTGDRTSFSRTADRDGRFAFARVPFGHYTLRVASAGVTIATALDVATGTVVDLPLVLSPEIGRTSATVTGVHGTPVSENTYGPRQLAALPANTSLDRIVETLPGIVRFSFDEPVAHGFHGLTYELDGAPLPQSTSANFAQLVDPRDVSAIEVFTGAFPAEFGGSRQGAVVNVTSLNTAGLGGTGALTLGGGDQGTAETRLSQHVDLGAAQIALAFNADRTDRGIDTPSASAQHDAADSANAFVRVSAPLGPRNTLAADLSAQTAAFQIPINTAFAPSSPIVDPPGTGDVQRETSRFASLSFTHASKDGLGYVQVVPWTRYDRLQYLGDLGNDVQAVLDNPDGSFGAFQNGLQQDRVASYTGLRASAYRASGRHALKLGADLSQESFRSAVLIACGQNDPPTCGEPAFTDDTARRGSQTGLYAEDKWTPDARLAVSAGLRYDRSTGYVSGGQLSPRLEVNQALGAGATTVLHAYYGRLYAAPGLEDTRRDAVLTETSSNANPVYDLQPERDTYVELGLAHTFRPGLRGYVNAFDRTVNDVLDTTNLDNTPLFIVFNNTVGVDRGVELRLTQSSPGTDAGLSFSYQHSVAGGISGSTFLLGGAPNDITLQPEDHDQTYSGNAFVTRRFGADRDAFATLEAEYGTGFPVAFQNGNGRLPAHTVLDALVGRTAAKGRLGYELDVENLLDHRYPIKVSNGFNTTQWNAPRRIVFRLTVPW